MSLLLALGTLLLVVISLFMVLVILMQRAKSDGGVGAALGGGMAESAFGGETANVLTKTTQYGAVLFFVLGFGLYLGRIHQHRSALNNPDSSLPSIEMPAVMDPLANPGAGPAGMPGLPPVEGAQPSVPAGDATPVPGTVVPADAPAPSATTPPAATP